MDLMIAFIALMVAVNVVGYYYYRSMDGRVSPPLESEVVSVSSTAPTTAQVDAAKQRVDAAKAKVEPAKQQASAAKAQTGEKKNANSVTASVTGTPVSAVTNSLPLGVTSPDVTQFRKEVTARWGSLKEFFRETPTPATPATPATTPAPYVPLSDPSDADVHAALFVAQTSKFKN